jgi:copper homeostasis protein
MDGSSEIFVEVCVASVADVEAAMMAGANRAELCSAPELGGLTPSVGLVEQVLAASRVPVVVMLRPRAGGFCYDRHEFAAMLADAERFLELGARGVVFGVLDRSGKIDLPRMREVVQRAGAAQTVFHRAFDFVDDRRAALDQLIAAGCTRILTSGGKPTAMEGAEAIRELIAHAQGRIEVLPAGQIRAANVVDLVRETGCTQVHLGAAMAIDDGSIAAEPGIELCDARFMRGYAHRAVAGDAVSATLKALRHASFASMKQHPR